MGWPPSFFLTRSLIVHISRSYWRILLILVSIFLPLLGASFWPTVDCSNVIDGATLKSILWTPLSRLFLKISTIRFDRRTQHAKTHLVITIFKGFCAKSPRPKSPPKAPFPVRAWLWRQVTWPIKNCSKCSETLLRDGVGGS